MLLRWASSQGGKAGFADPGYRALPPRAPSQAETAEAEEADAEQRPDRWFGGGSKKSDSYRVDRRWDDPVDPKPTRRQPQADEAPNPSGPGAKPKSTPTFSNSSHCRFEPFQGLGRSRKRHPAFALAAPAISKKTHTATVLLKTNFSPCPSACRQARFPGAPSLSD
jgi:hypothetical protein